MLGPHAEYPFSENFNRAIDTLRQKLDSGQICSFDEAESLVNSQISTFGSGIPHSAAFSAQCQCAEATYKFRQVGWLLDRVQAAANRLVSPAGQGDVGASHPPLETPNMEKLYELNGHLHTSSPPGHASTASSILRVTSPARKRKRTLSRQKFSPLLPGSEVPQITECPHCKQTFSGIPNDQKSNLRRHLLSKHPNPRQASGHICHDCGLGFPRSDYLSNHRKKHQNPH